MNPDLIIWCKNVSYDFDAWMILMNESLTYYKLSIISAEETNAGFL